MTDSDRPRILIVDDEEAILETMTYTFEDDYEVLTAPDAETAHRVLDDNAPVAVVISDQRMPRTTGVEFLSQVFERHPATTRIILTGFADMEATIKAINDGHVYAYVTKPWEPDELKQVVRRAVDFHRLRMENDRLLSGLQQANLFLEAVMDQLDTGALALDADGVVRAANRAALSYLGIAEDPCDRPLEAVLSGESLAVLDQVAAQLAGDGSGDYEEVDHRCNGQTLRLRISRNRLRSDGREIGSVILLREISHEPLRRRFEDAVQALARRDADLRPHLEEAVEEIGKVAERARGASGRSPGMAELAERAARTITALQNWLDVDDALAREDYPDAQLLRDRMRVAMARWPLPEAIPARVGELDRCVEAYYESGENPKQHVL